MRHAVCVFLYNVPTDCDPRVKCTSCARFVASSNDTGAPPYPDDCAFFRSSTLVPIESTALPSRAPMLAGCARGCCRWKQVPLGNYAVPRRTGAWNVGGSLPHVSPQQKRKRTPRWKIWVECLVSRMLLHQTLCSIPCNVRRKRREFVCFRTGWWSRRW